MKIAILQINPTVGDFTGNKRRILEGANRAAEAGVDLVMLPELAVSGYPPADLLEKSSFVERDGFHWPSRAHPPPAGIRQGLIRLKRRGLRRRSKPARQGRIIMLALIWI